MRVLSLTEMNLVAGGRSCGAKKAPKKNPVRCGHGSRSGSGKTSCGGGSGGSSSNSSTSGCGGTVTTTTTQPITVSTVPV